MLLPSIVIASLLFLPSIVIAQVLLLPSNDITPLLLLPTVIPPSPTPAQMSSSPPPTSLPGAQAPTGPLDHFLRGFPDFTRGPASRVDHGEQTCALKASPMEDLFLHILLS